MKKNMYRIIILKHTNLLVWPSCQKILYFLENKEDLVKPQSTGLTEVLKNAEEIFDNGKSIEVCHLIGL